MTLLVPLVESILSTTVVTAVCVIGLVVIVLLLLLEPTGLPIELRAQFSLVAGSHEPASLSQAQENFRGEVTKPST